MNRTSTNIKEMEPLIISSFSISGEHEADMLFMHLGCEANYVDKWIVTENSFDFKRRKKKRFLEELIKQDRFDEYRDRIFINSVSICSEHNKYFRNLPIYKPYYQQGYLFIPEQLQRLSAIPWLLENNSSPENTYVLVSDCDEFYTPSDEDHKQLIELLRTRSPDNVLLSRRKFHFDYDNISGQVRGTPLVNLGWSLLSPFERLAQARFRSAPGYRSRSHMISEYHNCFPMQDLIKKYFSHPHTVSFSHLEFALAAKMNHILVPINKIDCLEKNSDIRCETIELSSKYVPEFIQRNSKYLTKAIDKNYRKNRSICSLYSKWSDKR